MSLLNDALRKKKSESQPADTHHRAPLPGLGPKPKRKHHWVLYGCLIVLATAGCGAWLYWPETDAASSLKPPHPVSAAAAPASQDPPEKPVGGDISTPAQAITRTTAPKPAAMPSPPARKADPLHKQGEQSKPQITPVNPKAAIKNKATGTVDKKKRKPTPRNKSKPIVQSTANPVAPKRDTAKSRLQSDRLYKKARQYHRRNRLDQAISLYQEVIKIAPEHYKARFNLSAAYLQTEAYTKAYYIISDLYQKNPGSQHVRLNLAIAHIGLGRFQDALDLLNESAAQSEAPLFEIALHKGLALNQLGRPQDAMVWYKRAEAMRPDDQRLLFNLAVISDQQQRYEAAVQYYRRHIDNNPQIDVLKEKQIRRRIRTLLAYGAGQGLKE